MNIELCTVIVQLRSLHGNGFRQLRNSLVEMLSGLAPEDEEEQSQALMVLIREIILILRSCYRDQVPGVSQHGQNISNVPAVVLVSIMSYFKDPRKT